MSPLLKRPNIDFTRMRTVPVRVNGVPRLARYGRQADPDFWDDLWERENIADSGRTVPSSALSRTIAEMVGEGKHVIEAGCGDGRVVHQLNLLGLRCTGLDYAPQTIQRLQDRFPSYEFTCEDVRRLPYPDGTFDGYISLGVLEHFENVEDLKAALTEAQRCLKPAGLLFITVPFYNAARRLRAVLRMWHRDRAGLPFFEYAFSRSEITGLVEEAGFEVVRVAPTGSFLTVQQDLFLSRLFYLAAGLGVAGVLHRLVRLFCPDRLLGHMMLVVAQKAAAASSGSEAVDGVTKDD